MSTMSSDSRESDQKLSAIVANHYNSLEEKGVDARKESPIYHMRNFNNWVKSMTIADIINKIRDEKDDTKLNVLDIGCGKGGDLLKYKKASITHIICADIAETSVKQCEDRYNEPNRGRNQSKGDDRMFTAEFVTADCTRVNLETKYKNPNIEIDLVSIQFSFHYCFESLTQAECMIRNASQRLRIGGMFIGTTPDSQEIVKRLRNSGSNSFGNRIYSITFEDKYVDPNEKIPIFGAKYDFHLEGVVDCPEFLVYFPVFQEICSKYGLELVYRKSFRQIFDENTASDNRREQIKLLNIMDALEKYPNPRDRPLVGDPETDYKHAKNFYDRLSDNERRPIGTLSQSEWDAVSIYMAFCFKKVKHFEQNSQNSNKRLKT